LALVPGLAARTAWGGWTGLIAQVLLIGTIAQAAAPEIAFLVLWTGLLAALAAAIAAVVDPGLIRPRGLAVLAVAAVPGAGWLMAMAHPTFLGVGMDLPGVLALLGLLVLMLIRPFSPEQARARPLLMVALAVLVLGGAVSGAARLAEPAPAPAVAAT